MKTILIATDFSPVAHNAMNYGVDLAKSIGHSVTLVHVYQVPVAFADGPMVLVSVDDLRNSAQKQLEQLKSDLIHVHGKDCKVYTEAILGNVVESLQQVSQKIKPFEFEFSFFSPEIVLFSFSMDHKSITFNFFKKIKIQFLGDLSIFFRVTLVVLLH